LSYNKQKVPIINRDFLWGVLYFKLHKQGLNSFPKEEIPAIICVVNGLHFNDANVKNKL